MPLKDRENSPEREREDLCIYVAGDFLLQNRAATKAHPCGNW
jgi:hypothetical protein